MDTDRLALAIQALVNLVAQLRGPEGCPWDAAQTDATAKIYLLEEAYEVLDAVDEASPLAVCSELGDLLFQILFLAQLASERKEFDIVSVVETITEKMIHRHPHVFGETTVENAEDVATNWARIKRAEKGGFEKISASLRRVPSNLPALLRAHRLSERAAKMGFDWASAEEVWEKVQEEMAEVKAAMAGGDRNAASSELGDLLFSLTHLARHWGTTAEDLLRDANRKFLTRFQEMERRLSDEGIGLEAATLDQMNRAWDDAKQAER